jgi:hypothetical protein
VKVYVALAVLLTVEALHVPVIPFDEVTGKAGTAPPEQIVTVVPKLNVGVMFTSTVTVKVVGTAHCPAVGVNVYVPLAVLLTVAGLHVPVILFVDVTGKAGTVPPEQIARAVPKLNVGVRFGFTVILTVTGKAHKPAVGVKVYEPLVALLTVEGLHVPATPLLDVVGNSGAVAPLQILAGILNVGVVFGVTVTLIVTGKAHKPAVGVKV